MNIVEQTTKTGSRMQVFVTVSVSIAFIGVITALMCTIFVPSRDVPAGVKELLALIAGVLVSAYKDTVGYWMKSSFGSQQKTEMIAMSPPIPATPVPMKEDVNAA